MKGSFYGLSIKQLTLFLAAVAFTIILLIGWAKTPIISSLMPSQSPALKLPPDEKVKEQEVSKGVNGSDGLNPSANRNDNSTDVRGEIQGEEVQQKQGPKAVNGPEGVRPSSDKIASFNSTNTTSFSGANEKKNLTGVHEEIQETTTKHKDDLGVKQFVEGEEGSKLTKQNSVAPVSSVSTNSSLTGEEDVKVRPKNQDCNYAKGMWITDDNRPLYSGFGCKQWLSSMWACRLTQRTDFAFEKLRWQPKDCEMENFTGSTFLKRMQHKTLAFIGDSLGRQQFQSLMCMVTEGELRQDVLNVGWEFGLVKAPGHVRPDGWAYRFPSTNTTILYYWSASLCNLEPLNITNPLTDYAMHLDRPPAFLQRFLPRFDVLVLNTGHHWNRGKLQANRWIMHVGGKPNTDKKIADIPGAKNFTIYSIVNWVNSELPKYPGLKAFYRTISPRHFFNGDWNTGGTCDNTTPRSGNLEVLQDESSDPTAAGSVKGTKVKLLDITAVSQLRDEGHISRYSIKATPGMQDCLHWCLPGVPDTWNEILFAQL